MAVSYRQIFRSSEPSDVEAAARRAQLANALQIRALQPTMNAGPQNYDGKTAFVDLANALATAYNAKRANDAYDRAKQSREEKVSASLKDYSKSVSDERVGAAALKGIMEAPDDQLPEPVTGRSEAAANLATAAGPEAQQALAIAMMQRDMGAQRGGGTHVVGNSLVDDKGKVLYQADAVNNMYGRINPGDFTPESLAKFNKSQDFNDLVRVWAPVNPTVQNLAGGQSLVAPSRTGGAPQITQLTTPEQEQAAAEAKATATAKGGVVGEARGGVDKKAIAANSVLGTLDIADSLIDASTGSLVGTGVDKLAAVFGASLDGAQAIAQLKTLQGSLLMSMPRMEGPQSDADRQNYIEAAGQIADSTVPRETRKAAIKTIRQLQEKYRAAAGSAPPPEAPSDDDLLRKYGG